MSADPADRILRVGDRRRIGERPAQSQRLEGVLEGLGVTVLLAEQQGKPVMGLPDAGPVAELDEKRERAPQVRVGRLVVTEPGAHVAQVVVHVGERNGVAEPVRRRQGQLLDREHLMHPTASLQLRRPEPGQHPAVLVKPVRGGELEDAAQYPLLGQEPAQRRLVGGIGGSVGGGIGGVGCSGGRVRRVGFPGRIGRAGSAGRAAELLGGDARLDRRQRNLAARGEDPVRGRVRG